MRSRSLLLGVATALLGVGAALLVGACAAPTALRPARPGVGFGQPIGEADLAAWNIDIRTSDGLGLPPGRGTAAEGRAVYNAKCVACHGAEAKGGPTYGTMVGGIGSFKSSLRVVTPGSMYPYAPIHRHRPQTLTADEVYAVSAYLLHVNGLIPADAVMDAHSLPNVSMPNRDGFIPDDRPDTRAVRCMRDCK